MKLRRQARIYIFIYSLISFLKKWIINDDFTFSANSVDASAE